MLHLWVRCPQVPFFLFIVFVVYALLPLSTRAAITVGVVSTVSHLLVFGAVTGAFRMSMSGAQLGLQVRVTEAGWGQALAWWRLSSGTVFADLWQQAGPWPVCLDAGLGYSVDSGPHCAQGPAVVRSCPEHLSPGL